ncbi:MAG: hypothetical protein A2252_12215 [Elusimicrobia bacterium RIFOXYA2_FULL_39_19]|nr:MAG: hypothetical protein A2252_12215 [Elusimicrobia bacterium RIFOXYA2_FULL_39_19]
MKKMLIVMGCIVCVLSVFYAYKAFSKQGEHIGEQKMLAVNIEFNNSVGKTVTSAQGVDYYFQNGSLLGHEAQVYPEKYWGEFPMYFFGMPTGVKVTVTNIGPRAKDKIRIITESYVLRTDGSNGPAMCEPKVIEVELSKGETKSIDATFTTPYSPAAESGLDRFIVKVQHSNEGSGPGNNEPALVMSKEGIYCPPKYTPK